MTSEPPALRLFLDRSTQGKRFIAAVRRLVQDVETIDDRYGREAAQSVPDTRWIAEATADGRVLVGADRNILRNPLERGAICMAAARYVVFATNNMQAQEMIERFERHLPRIRELVTEPGPWVYRIASHDMRPVRLNCDDVR